MASDRWRQFQPPVNTETMRDQRPMDPPRRVAYRNRHLGTGTGMLTAWARQPPLPGWFGYVHHDESTRCTWFPASDLRPLE